MVVQAAWPGATLEDTLPRSPSGSSVSWRKRRGSTPAQLYRPESRRSSSTKGHAPGAQLPDAWYRSAITSPTSAIPCRRARRSLLQRPFRRTFGMIYGSIADGFSDRELRDHVEAARSRPLIVPDVSKIEIIGAQDEQSSSSSRPGARRSRHRSQRPARRAAGAEQWSARRLGADQHEKVSLRVSGAFRSEQDMLNVNFPVGDRMIRLGDIARSAAAMPIRRNRCSASTARPPWARHRDARRRRHSGTRQQHQEGHGGRSPPICRSASSLGSFPSRP